MSNGTLNPMLTHFGFHVVDLKKMIGFYQRILGLTIMDQGRGINLPEDMVFLSNSPDVHHQLMMCTGRSADELKYNHINQISCLVESLEQMQEVVKRLDEEGTPITRQLDHGNAWSYYFFDPEGNTVEIYANTPWHVQQPWGRVFDVREPVDKIMAETLEYAKAQTGFQPREDYIESMRQEMAG